jgi:hypothetical protein
MIWNEIFYIYVESGILSSYEVGLMRKLVENNGFFLFVGFVHGF